MKRSIRLMMFIAALFQIVLAIGFFTQMSWTKTLWPFNYTNQLSFIFMSSIAGAAAASTLWCLYSHEERGLAGIALDYIFLLGPIAIFSWQKYNRIPNEDLILLIIAGASGAVSGIVLFLWSRRIPFRQTQRTPLPVRIAFMVFVVALFLVGGALILQVKNIMPWTLTPEISMLYGWFFIGAAVYFIYGLLHPVWGNAGGQLAGFLVYDLVLIIPFLQHFSEVRPSLVPNLVIYIAVLVASGAIAVYYLFINPNTQMPLSQAALAREGAS